MQLWRLEKEMDGINVGNLLLYLVVSSFPSDDKEIIQKLCEKLLCYMASVDRCYNGSSLRRDENDEVNMW